jgi:hypothetical protein
MADRRKQQAGGQAAAVSISVAIEAVVLVSAITSGAESNSDQIISSGLAQLTIRCNT